MPMLKGGPGPMAGLNMCPGSMVGGPDIILATDTGTVTGNLASIGLPGYTQKHVQSFAK